MKGFLSFLGITFVTVAFGSILLSFYGNPLEDLKVKERQLAYQEMRANHTADAEHYGITTLSSENDGDKFYIEDGQSCGRLSFEQ